MSEYPLPVRDQVTPLKDVWTIHEEDIKTKLRGMMKVRTRDTEEDIAKNLQTLLEREHAFLTHLVAVLEKAAQDTSYAKQLILFDIDETIARSRFLDETGRNKVTLFRPVFMALLPALAPRIKDGTLEIGILSTRSQEGMEIDLGDPNNLQPIAQYINPEQVYSSRGASHTITYETLKDVPIVDNSKVATFDGLMARVSSGDYDKLSKLSEIRIKNPDKSIVVVDDFVFPALLDEKQGLYGCALDNGEGFFLR